MADTVPPPPETEVQITLEVLQMARLRHLVKRALDRTVTHEQREDAAFQLAGAMSVHLGVEIGPRR